MSDQIVHLGRFDPNLGARQLSELNQEGSRQTGQLRAQEERRRLEAREAELRRLHEAGIEPGSIGAGLFESMDALRQAAPAVGPAAEQMGKLFEGLRSIAIQAEPERAVEALNRPDVPPLLDELAKLGRQLTWAADDLSRQWGGLQFTAASAAGEKGLTQARAGEGAGSRG